MYGFLQEYLVDFAYGGVFLVLLLCGLGLPIPEDIPIITSGYLVHLGTMAFWPALTVSLLGIMLGDLIIYSFGYWMGPRHSSTACSAQSLRKTRWRKCIAFSIVTEKRPFFSVDSLRVCARRCFSRRESPGFRFAYSPAWTWRRHGISGSTSTSFAGWSERERPSSSSP